MLLWNYSLDASSGSSPLLLWRYNNSSYLQAQRLQFLSPRAWSNLILPPALLCRQTACNRADWHDIGSSAYRRGLWLKTWPGLWVTSWRVCSGALQRDNSPSASTVIAMVGRLDAGCRLCPCFSPSFPLAPRMPFRHVLMTAQRWEGEK